MFKRQMVNRRLLLNASDALAQILCKVVIEQIHHLNA
ncbi:hypothetical protein GGR91_000894 [Sphingorhabdus rigui]|uniref:Uncharacterized protein n=1 Tax=Sphingorhabdus rigui TaxID=1282858 RepID=A0A840B0A9_9SPHN|nr:hypothetical protein [Sphingorhabdus rigui]